MKKIISVILITLMLLTMTASANGEISVFVNGNKLSFDVPPQTVNDRTMVPLRAIFESLGATVEWFEETRTVKATLGDKVISLTLDSNLMYVNESTVTLDAPAFETGGRTLVPVRAISEAFGATVGWEEETKTVSITTVKAPLNKTDAFNNVKNTLSGKDGIISKNITENGGLILASYDAKDNYIVLSYYAPDKTSSVSLLVYEDADSMITVSAYDSVVFGAEYTDGKIVVAHNQTGAGNESTVNRAVSGFTKAIDIALAGFGCNATASDLGMIVTEKTADGELTVEKLNEIKIARADYKLTTQNLTADKFIGQTGDASSEALVTAVKKIPYFIPVEGNKGPVILLKCDDFRIASMETFRKLHPILMEEGINNVSYGVIGEGCVGKGEDEFWADVKKYISDGVEIWHHGWDHKISGDTGSEFSGGYEYDVMREHFSLTIDLVKKNTGYDIATIGAPGNKVSSDFAKLLNEEFPQIKQIYFSQGRSFNAFPLNTLINPESGTSGVQFSTFMKNYDADHNYAVIQFHPHRLDAYDCWDDFIKMIQYLKSQNCVFMTPTQYTEYVKSK